MTAHQRPARRLFPVLARGAGVLLLVLVIAVGPARADERTISNAEHGFTLTLPAGWYVKHLRDNDFADARFGLSDPRLSGFYQVYEGAVTDKPKAWYENARTRYESAARSMPGVTKIEFSDLEPARLGGQEAWSFGFVTLFKAGPPVATRVVFTLRRTGQRVDMHEVFITGDAPAMAQGEKDVGALLQAVKFNR